ncbi:MAG: DUF2750 domain-containing protein [Odoribacteraceae bacterium]|jgi:hypothetical protein|nr:DUF2750 domain-containing protein [Odoribacteraceae bacterium]
MKQEEDKTSARYENFIRRVCETGVAWTLRDDEGFVTTDSNEYENEEGEALALFCFWSGEGEARACAVEQWSAYRPEAIPLGTFIEEWCVWMSDDEMLAGIEFDGDLVGHEQEPLQLVLDLASELSRTGRQVTLSKFERLEELTAIIERLVREAGEEG